MRFFTLTFFLCLVVYPCLFAQPQGFSKTKLDSLEKLLNTLPNDTNRVNTLFELGTLYSNTNVEKSILIGEEALRLIRKLNYSNGFRKGLGPLSFQYTISGQWAKGLELALEGKERYKDVLNERSNYSNMAQLAYQFQGDDKRCLEECHENIQLFNNHPEIEFSLVDKWATYMTASEMYGNMQQGDSALIFALQSLGYAQNIQFNTMNFVGYAHNAIGKAFLKQNMPDSALYHLHIMRVAMEQIDNQFALQETQVYLSKAMQNKGIRDSLYYYAKTAYDGAVKMGNDINEMNAALILSEYFDQSNAAQSLFYLKRYNAIKEKVFTQDQTNKRYFLESQQRNKLIELEKKEINTKNRIKQNSLLGSLLTFVLLAVILIYTNRRKKLLNDKLQQQKIQIEHQNLDLVHSSKELATKNNDLKIEVALDQVRARSLEMRKSDELKEVVATLYDQLRVLGFKYGAASILIMDSTKNDLIQWVGGFDQSEYPIGYQIKSFNHPAYIAQFSAWKNGDKYLELLLTDDEKRSFDEYMFTQTDFKKFPEEGKVFMKSLSSVVFSLAFLKYGALQWGPEKLNDEQARILQKFALVFEQAYTRFLDLQKAEAQAREAQIEAALEKVRSASLAIHQSQELEKVVIVLFDKLKELRVPFDSAIIYLFDKPKRNMEAWVASKLLQDPIKVNMPYDEEIVNNPIITDLWYAIEMGEHGLNKSYKEKDKDNYYRYEAKHNKSIIPESISDFHLQAESWTTSFATEKNSIVAFDNWDGHLTSTEDFQILKRFAKVFEQAYIRFLDLQKAEEQTKEAQIELALERVRAKTMAMQKSHELREVAATIFEQLQQQGFNFGALAIVIMDEISGDSDWWMSGFGNDYPEKYKIPFFNHRFYLEQLSNWKEGKKYAVMEVSGEEKKMYDDYIFSQTDFTKVSQEAKNVMCGFEEITFSNAYMKHGALSWGTTPISEEDAKILQRFATVFEQTYTRFLDLKLAEAQAREAQIEASLERIRSRAMAMNTSEEFNSLIGFIYVECTKLNMHLDRGFIMTFNEATKDALWWMVSADVLEEPLKILVEYHEYAPNLAILKGWEEREQRWTYNLEGNNKKTWDDYQFANALSQLPAFVKDNMRSVKSVILNASFQNFGCIMLSSFEPLSNDQFDLIQKFSKVFDQTYTRFLDLQKAEAQAREAQIELSLERVRARAMAMQTSEEINVIIGKIFLECTSLDIQLDSSFIIIYDEQTHDTQWYLTNHEAPEYPARFSVPYNQYPFNKAMLNAWHQKTIDWDYMLDIHEKKEWDRFIFSKTDFVLLPNPIKEVMASVEKLYIKASFNEFGCLMLTSLTPLNNEQMTILPRFSKVFELTYTRFLDLQKAEAQAREAKIEVALERVRARAMAMQKSDELADAARILYHEFGKLGIKTLSCGYMFIDENKQNQTAWVTLPDGTILPNFIDFPLTGDNVLDSRYESWKAKKSLHSHTIQGKANREHHEFLSKHVPESVENDIFAHIPDSITFYNANFSSGYLLILAPNNLSADEEQIIIRFAKVFELTYTRFTDLKQAEAQVREAQIEASFERIRASALAMQTSNEFLGVVQTLYEQINALGQKELEATIIQFYDIEQGFINSWNAQNVDKSSAGNITLGTTHIPFDACRLTLEWLNAYQSNQEDYTIIAKDDILEEWLLLLMTMSPEIKDRLGESMPQISNFHFSKFSRGALSMVSQKPFSEESKYLLKRAASAFDLAYKRYLDLQLKEEQAIKLADEKQRLEAALKELQTTQAQLIQSEKLASLGELTAGIAHEIQNPLNFVNNFSELSVDLAKELKEERSKELEKRDEDLENDLIDDLISNQEKINHHGKRASDIVKAMLEHSRTSTGQKELADINALCGDYLRLTYQGLKAKNKDFNATMETHFDPNLPKIEIIPQEIGRVLLNLITNAFYAVNERNKQLQRADSPSGVGGKGGQVQEANYIPTVLITTKLITNSPNMQHANSPTSQQANILIAIKDNGLGIPSSIIDKIFQPFFTTKPTGQGTGLGLSLAYDIVKAHGGEIKAESTENMGTEFTVSFPIKDNN